jgi:shikimate kinase
MTSHRKDHFDSKTDVNLPIVDRPIVLVGTMGVGKSSIGKKLAERLDIPFADADHEIESAAGLEIKEIFARYGEPYFRDGERRVIKRLLDGKPRVIATGGGAFVQTKTREIIMKSSRTIWLDASIDILVERVSRRDNRPLLHNRDPYEVFTELKAIRDPYYRMADIHISSGTSPHAQTVDDIIEALHRGITS